MTFLTQPRRIERFRFELRRRATRVEHITTVSPSFVRVALAGEDLRDFRSLSFDDHVKLGFPGQGAIVLRDFTPRAFDAQAGRLDIEFALHDHGPATAWARAAGPGDELMVGGPRGSMVIPMDYDWHLLAGDASALPAIARRLEELPAGARALVLVEVPDAADQRPLATSAQAEVRWFGATADWLAALEALALPAGEGFAWCAGEAQAMKSARALLADRHGLPREAMKVAAYWKRGEAGFHHETLGG